MKTRRDFLLQSGAVALGSITLPSFALIPNELKTYGVQLYTFRNEMDKDPIGTLKQIASLGIKKIKTIYQVCDLSPF